MPHSSRVRLSCDEVTQRRGCASCPPSSSARDRRRPRPVPPRGRLPPGRRPGRSHHGRGADRTPAAVLSFPLRHHFEQSFHVRHRLERYRGGRRMEFETATLEGIALAIAEEIGRGGRLPVGRDRRRRLGGRPDRRAPLSRARAIVGPPREDRPRREWASSSAASTSSRHDLNQRDPILLPVADLGGETVAVRCQEEPSSGPGSGREKCTTWP